MQRLSVARTFHMTHWRRWVFGRFLKVEKVSELTTLSSSEFHTVGAVTEKARLARTARVRGTASLGAWLDRSSREGTCGTSSDCHWRSQRWTTEAVKLTHVVFIDPDSVTGRAKSFCHFEHNRLRVPLITDEHVTTSAASWNTPRKDNTLVQRMYTEGYLCLLAKFYGVSRENSHTNIKRGTQFLLFL